MRTGFVALALLLLPALPVPLRAAPAAAPGAAAPLAIDAGSGQIVRLHGAAANVFTADPKVAEVRPASPDSLFVFGVAPGRTTIAAMSAGGAAVGMWQVTVVPPGGAAALAARAAAQALPGAPLSVTPDARGVTLSGTLPTAGDAERAAAAARDVLPPGAAIDNRTAVQSPVTVSLRVRIAEMSRTLTREIGVNWQAMAQLGKYASIGLATSNVLANLTNPASSLSGGYHFPTPGRAIDLNTVIDALSEDQLVHVLAEPNLTALSGETASFIVGGEFPIPVANQNQEVTIDFKQYGVSLAFVPTVVSPDRISLHVRPEVSELTDQGAVRLAVGNSSLQIPALTVRRADTTIELGSGQSFAIAGLLQDSTKITGLGLPFLGDVPILGALFRSDSFQRGETELVIVVTPYIVRPADDPSALKLPTDGWHPPSDLERILLLRQSGRGAPPPRIAADAGFVLE
jgi:pilus assembly protein CpaC